MDFQPLPGNPPEQPEMAPAPRPADNRKKSLKNWMFAGIGAAVLVIGGATISAASGSGGPSTQTPTTIQPGGQQPDHDGMHPGHGHGAGGTIASIDGTTLTVNARSGGTVTVTTSADTTVTKASPGAVSDVHVGDNVLVMGQATGTDVTARGIVDFRSAQPPARPKDDPDPNRPPDADHFEPVNGQVTAVNGATLTVKAADKTYIVTTSADTHVSLVQTLSVSDLKVGDTVHVMGDTSGTTVAAKHISVGDLEGPGGMHGPGDWKGMHRPGGHSGAPDGDADDSGSTDSSGTAGTSSPTTL